MHKKFRLLIFLIPLILCSCTGLSNIKKDNKTKSNLNKVGFIESFFLDDISCNFNFKGIDINYKGLDGSVNMFNIYALTKEREVELRYKSSVKKGNVKVVILMPDNKVVNMFEGKKEGSIKTKFKGHALIKCIGENFTGNIKIDVSEIATKGNEDDKETEKLAQGLADGEYIIQKLKLNNNIVSGNIYRIKVINQKIDKLAKISVQGELDNDILVTKYQDDGWGNSGNIELDFTNGVLNSYKITITNKKQNEWGFEEGVYTPVNDNKKIPENILNSLN